MATAVVTPISAAPAYGDLPFAEPVATDAQLEAIPLCQCEPVAATAEWGDLPEAQVAVDPAATADQQTQRRRRKGFRWPSRWRKKRQPADDALRARVASWRKRGRDFVVARVPAGARAGETIQIVTPSGQTITTTVPRGYRPGQMFMVPLTTPCRLTAKERREMKRDRRQRHYCRVALAVVLVMCLL